jgi:hypothetical protein
MPCVQVVFEYRIVSPFRDRCRIVLYGSPEVCHESIGVIDGLDAIERHWTAEQNCAASKEWLDVVRHVAETLPHDVSNPGFSSKPGERCLSSVHLAPFDPSR